jgi:hypothetical protein
MSGDFQNGRRATPPSDWSYWLTNRCTKSTRMSQQAIKVVNRWSQTIQYNKGKGKVYPGTDHEGPEGE